MPAPDPEIQTALWDANSHLQRVSDYLGRGHHEDLRLRFPRGFLRTAQQHRARFPGVSNRMLERNVGYSLMLADVYEWLLYRTDIASVPADMIVKAGIALQGAVAEALLVDALSDTMGRRQPFKNRTAKLVEHNRISPKLKAELDWVWDMRNQQHLYELTESEFDFYSRTDLERATVAVAELGVALAR